MIASLRTHAGNTLALLPTVPPAVVEAVTCEHIVVAFRLRSHLYTGPLGSDSKLNPPRDDRPFEITTASIAMLLSPIESAVAFARYEGQFQGLAYVVAFPLILLLLTWKKVTWQGVIAGLVTGFVTTVVWSEITLLDQVISVRFVSWVLAFLAVWLTSIVTRRKSLIQP